MVADIVEFTPQFEKIKSKIRDPIFKDKVKKQVKKIIEEPETGKPMMHERKGTREVYVSPYRLSYTYIPEENKLIFLTIYHKDEQ